MVRKVVMWQHRCYLAVSIAAGGSCTHSTRRAHAHNNFVKTEKLSRLAEGKQTEHYSLNPKPIQGQPQGTKAGT